MQRKNMSLWSVMLLALSGLLMTASCSKYKYEEVKEDLSKTRIYTLDNGLKVYLSVNKEKPRLQTYIVVRTGSKNDPAETTGLAHYLEHLMFKGTSKYGVTDPEAEAPLLADIEARYEKYRTLTDAEERRQAYHEIDSVSQLAAQYFIPNEYDKLMSLIGAEGSNANTWYDRTCYIEDIPSNQIENWLKVESDRFKSMTIRGFHTELEAVYEEYNIHLSEDGEKTLNALMSKLFPTHPYGTQTTIGTQEHLKNPSITNIKNYFKKWYVPNNTAICLAGDFDPDEAITLIDKYFGDWQKGEDVNQPTFPEQPELTAPVDTIVIGLESEQLALGWRFEKGASSQADTLEVINNMLSNGTAGLIDLNINQQMTMLGAGSMAEPLMDYTIFLLMGVPREGQTLDEVRALLLAEIEKLKKGEFSDDLLSSVVNNLKLQYYNALEANRARTDMYLEAFVNGISWESYVHRLDRMAGMTKDQIMEFAKRHFKENYVAVYKRQGVDESQKKIEKPAITPISANRDAVSQFVKDIQDSKVTPIEPVFVDFQRDLTFGEGSLPYIYVQNKENGRFTLAFRYDFGDEADVRYSYAASYLDYLGTDSLTAEQVKQQFYKLACHFNVNVGARNITVSLNGLSENMPQALALLEHVMNHAKVDMNAYAQFVAMLDKSMTDKKLSQEQNFSALTDYGTYGTYNPTRNILSVKTLMQTNPQELVDLLKTLGQYPHTLLYYGPLPEEELTTAVQKEHHLPAELLPIPENKHFVQQATPENEILLAPYDAKNIYMQMLHVTDSPYNVEEACVRALFNEYYGGSMGSVVFQELRETRGLAYSAFAGYIAPNHADQKEYAIAYIITQNDKMMDAVRQFHVILDTIPQSESSFQIAKEGVMKRIASQRTTKFGLINAWLKAQQLGIDFDENERIYRELPDMTLQDIVDFADSHMAHNTYRYMILGNEKELDMKALEQYGPVKRLTTEEIFGY